MPVRATALRSLVPLLLLAAWTASVPPPAHAVVPGLNGRIVFASAGVTASNPEGDSEIFTIDADGSDAQQITSNTFDEFSPVWSPDGKKIAFSTNASGDYEIFVMNADGSNPVNLTKTPGIDETPAWSPDGTRIAFTSARDGGLTDLAIWVMQANGTGQTKLTTQVGNEIFPSWSPDGTRIAFEKQGTGFQVYVMNADGSNQVNLTAVNGNNFEREPRWSPDGQLIAFYRQVGFQNEIYTMNPDGSLPTNLTNNASNDYEPIFSPDGTQIVFVTNRGGNGGPLGDGRERRKPGEDHERRRQRVGARLAAAAVLRAADLRRPSEEDPERPDRVLQQPRDAGEPRGRLRALRDDGDRDQSATTDGQQRSRRRDAGLVADRNEVAFTRIPPGGTTNSDIFTVNADGTGLTRLTTSIEIDRDPVWSPNARRIAWVRRILTGPTSSDNDILVMDPDGANKVDLTLNSFDEDESPTWGVDSRRLAFTRYVGGCCLNPDIFTMDADGANQVNITNTPLGTEEINPAWSPSGKKIAFARRDSTSFPEFEIWTINPDGSGLTRITSAAGPGVRYNAAEPAWSPDSRWIVYVRSVSPPDGLQSEIVTIKADGSGPANISNNPALDQSPTGRSASWRRPTATVRRGRPGWRQRWSSPSRRGYRRRSR